MNLECADAVARAWAERMVSERHYLHSAPDPRGRPFCYVVRLGGEPVGCLFFGRPESTRCYQGGLTYGSQEDVRSGKAEFDRWEVLNLSRVWYHPDVQPGGRLHAPEYLPGFTDRHGVFRSTLASDAMRAAFARVGFDYLMRHPPCFVDEPYAVRAAMSYCDTNLHRGTIYRAAGMMLARTNETGIQTWWTPEVAGLTPAQDEAVRRLAANHPRSRRIREASRSLFDLLDEVPAS